ncbi:uncharacterized protein CC84DRAFT_1220430 [Paraphaeosphaeria sporulosa]|uniref:HD domain-containing protein n=1 Tax=Paraphaeosphaeria sporulosa TaxID=1460663 RepID=A0A177C5M0_9PLEO|nr:uncharacterized protein CC84DRAFT_1220430 [Paraphaeosphaeria sporulosa]OAG02068.1 hypothetical protein CC84DRAFT_1220430 [Paraphaeosphaeria sporulosa]
MDARTIHIPDHIKQCYQQPNRHYHNLGHVAHMLRLVPDDHPHMLELVYATWLHDCVYDPKAAHSKNEGESIRTWRSHVEENEGLSKIKDIVSLMIECTMTHKPPYEPPADEAQIELINRFLDMDMDILAFSREGYLGYAKKVRREYAHLTDEQFRKGRAAFLRSAIDKGNVFPLDENPGKNEIALGNMKAEP